MTLNVLPVLAAAEGPIVSPAPAPELLMFTVPDVFAVKLVNEVAIGVEGPNVPIVPDPDVKTPLVPDTVPPV